jgi:hypothetical protein
MPIHDEIVLRPYKKSVSKHLAGKHDQSTHGNGGGNGEMRVVDLEQRKKEIEYENQSFLARFPAQAKDMLQERMASEATRTTYEKNGIRLMVDNETAAKLNISDKQIEAILDAGRAAMDKIPTDAKNRLVVERQKDDFMHSDALIIISNQNDWMNGMANAATMRNQLPASIRISPNQQQFKELFEAPVSWSGATSTIRKQPRLLDYVMHHEVGHAIDVYTGRNPMATKVWNQVVDSGLMSSYGGSAEAEGFADAWAEFVYSGRNAMTAPYIDLAGWDK